MGRPVVLVTMGGQGLRFKQAGITEPKPFVSVLGQPMIKHVMNLFPKNWPSVFVLNDQDYQETHLDYLKKLRPDNSAITYVKTNSGGPLQTVINGLEKISDDQPVFVTYCDYGQTWDAEDFLKFVEHNSSDVCFVAYKNFHPHYLGPNMYCYLKTEGSKVLDIKEKECFSKNREDDFASTGGYYFKSAGLLKAALSEQQKQNLNWNGEFFTSLAVKALHNVRPDLKMFVYEVNQFFQWGTPEDLKSFEYWAKVDYEKFK